METPSSGGNLTIIERVLRLREQMGIDNGLSALDARDAIFFLSQVEALECSMNVPDVQDCLRWLAWPRKTDDPDPEPGVIVHEMPRSM